MTCNEKKRIALLLKNPVVGGAERQAVVTANVLSADYEVYFAVFNDMPIGGQLLDKLSPAVTKLKLTGNAIKKTWELHKFLKRERIDFLLTFLTGANGIGAIASLGTPTHFYSGLSSSRLPLHKLLSDLFVAQCMSRGIVSNSYSARDWFARYCLRKSRIHVIPNCFVNNSEASDDKRAETPTIITVARFVREKDLFTALKAVKVLKGKGVAFKYLLVGYGTLEHDLRQFVADNGLDNTVEFHINPPNVDELLNRADIYLCTSLYEGTSNSVLEAMHFRLALVATDVGDNALLLGNSEGGTLVTPGDAAVMAHRLSELINNPTQCRKMGERNRQTVHSMFSHDNFKILYGKLLEKP